METTSETRAAVAKYNKYGGKGLTRKENELVTDYRTKLQQAAAERRKQYKPHIDTLAELAKAEREKAESFAKLRDQCLLAANENDENLAQAYQAEKNREIAAAAAERLDTLANRVGYLTTFPRG